MIRAALILLVVTLATVLHWALSSAGSTNGESEFARDYRTSWAEFGKVSVLASLGVGVPLLVGGVLAVATSSIAIGWASAAAFAFVIAWRLIPSVLNRFDWLRPDGRYWDANADIRLDSLKRRTGLVYWAIVVLTGLLVAFALVLVAAR